MFQRSLPWMVRQGYLVPLDGHRIMTDTDLSGIKVKGREGDFKEGELSPLCSGAWCGPAERHCGVGWRLRGPLHAMPCVLHAMPPMSAPAPPQLPCRRSWRWLLTRRSAMH